MISPVPHIQRATAEVYGIPIDGLLGTRRHRELARPRQLAMALSYVHTKHSHPEVGRFFCRDHATVSHARTKIREVWDENMRKAAVEIMFSARDAWEAEKKQIRQLRNRSATT